MGSCWRRRAAAAAGWTAMLTGLLVVRAVGAARGTTPNLRQIFIGRCWEYQAVVNSAAFQLGTKNCTRLYQDFLWAFEGREPCDVQLDRYKNYTQAASHPIEPNKSMFWIGVYHLVHRYSEMGRRFMTISDSMTGYLVNNLVWCGKSGGGLDTEFCPSYGSCGHETSVSFWRATSIHYASLARGTAYLMLNGTRGTAFTDTSVFAQYELPNIDVKRVTTVHAYIIHDIGRAPRESCKDTNTSITKLKRVVLARGLQFECTDDPFSVRLLQCVDQPWHAECLAANSAEPRPAAAGLPTLAGLLIPVLHAVL